MCTYPGTGNSVRNKQKAGGCLLVYIQVIPAMFVLYVSSAILTLFLVRWLVKHLAYRAVFNSFPGETDFRIITGNMHKLPGNNEEGLSYDLENARKYKYFHRVWAGPLLGALVVYHPDLIKPILKSQAPKPRKDFLISSAYDMGIPWLGEGLLLANGDKWARSRRLLTPAFHFDILKSYVGIYNTCTDILAEKLNQASGKSCEVYSLISYHTLDIILQCAFSYKSNCQSLTSGNEYIQAISELQALWSKRSLKPELFIEFIYSLTADGKQFYRLCDVAHRVSEEVIAKRRLELEKNPSLINTKKVKDFLDILLTARDEDGNGLTPLELRNEVDTFMFEGHDTTASALTWILFALAEHPEQQEKIYEEVAEVMGDRENIEWSDLPKLEYTTMCIKEGIRLHGPVPAIERNLSEDLKFNEFTIPTGTRVLLHLYVLHHNPHVWEQPMEFLPERFHPDKQQDMNPFQFVPFSAGSRNCIGQNFAMNEMKITIAKIIKKFKLNIDPTHKSRHLPLVTMKTENGVYLLLTPRS